jgi:hypothetical protein
MPPLKKPTDSNTDLDEPRSKEPMAVLDEATIQRSILISEADTLSRQGNYSNAIPLYTKAIEMKTSEILLLCRSRCRTFMGDISGALKDAEDALVLNASSFKALLCKADVLFAKGDFEVACIIEGFINALIATSFA